jgi:uncharacterized OB-fold protein
MAEKRPDRVVGPGHDDFWAACARGELALPRCADCTGLTWPVAKTCEHCGSTRLSWETMSGRARLASWCAFERDYYGGLLPLPWDTILVELEEGPMFISNPAGLAWDDYRLDMPLKLAFIDCEDKHGAFRLPVFEQA